MSEWVNYKLGDLGTFTNGINKDKNSFGFGYPFVNLLDVFDKDIIYQKPLGLVNASQDELNRYSIKAGDILFVRSSVKLDGVGKVCAVANNLESTTFSGFIIRFRPSELLIDNIFASYYLNSSPIRRQVISKATLSANSNINQESLKSIQIQLPNLEHQRKISKVLFATDAVIEQTKSAIAKYKAIKQGLLHDLFTRGVDVNGHLRPSYSEAPELYKESELGMIPKDWEVKRLEELTEKIGSGVTPTGGSEVYLTSGVLFIRSQNVLVGSLSIEDAAYITTEIDEKMEGSRVKPYDVFLNITGASIGRSAYFPVELKLANVNQHVCIIRFKGISKSLAIYASEFLNSNFGQTQIYKSIAGGNREGLNFQQIKSFSFPSISEGEIDGIAKIIELQSNKIQIEETLLQKYQSIKRGLMGDLLGGKKKVKISE